jgi:hypothetical protein
VAQVVREPVDDPAAPRLQAVAAVQIQPNAVVQEEKLQVHGQARPRLGLADTALEVLQEFHISGRQKIRELRRHFRNRLGHGWRARPSFA